MSDLAAGSYSKVSGLVASAELVRNIGSSLTPAWRENLHIDKVVCEFTVLYG